MNFKVIPALIILTTFSLQFAECQTNSINFEKKIQLLVKDTSLLSQVIISDSSTILYDTLGSENISNRLTPKQIQQLSYLANSNHSSKKYSDTILQTYLPWFQKTVIPPLTDSTKPLNGVKIALDPGHLAYDFEMSKIEGKFIEIKSTNSEFYEANLTLCTARILKAKLELMGAQVLITRDSPTYIKNEFYDWYKTKSYHSIDSLFEIESIDEEEKKYLYKVRKRNTLLSKKILFNRIYKHIDYNIRADIINQFNPLLSIVIHYNVDSDNKYWTKPTDKNYSMVFVPGSFMEGELNEYNEQLEFIRLLFSNDLSNSISFSSQIAESFKTNLKVELAKPNSADYLEKYCLPTEYEGVFARNLALTRKIKGIVCYGETLFQDNREECILLNQKNIKIEELNCNDRVKEVANAYYYGILNYIKKSRASYERN